ncbi:MAG: DUF2809 domain-containing protein [candidate division KSB1 bacterium]|nr:DUF2809 domain-containing protein [candidate division KSB1 bacterium]
MSTPFPISRIPRKAVLISLLIVTPLGFMTKFYRGPSAWWFNDYAGGLLYEVFWCLVVIFIWPRASALMVAGWVLVVTCLLEFLQLYHSSPFLEAIRATFIGRTLIGTSFAWWDFPYYVIGCGMGWLWIRLLSQKSS